ncbi:MAG: hypothetical protein QGG64_11530 [Candidatus Latescibacteria bacterium]|jgi:hypothetical protein|nr:hypothetical protein [Candidatus Latescibacterota bacterium]
MKWMREPQLHESLDLAIPDILSSQKENGQFGTEPWISTDQNVLLALSAAWSLEESAYYQSEQILDAIILGGDALIAAQDDAGMFTFRKKDHSTWGQIYMPWVYSRWMRAFGIVRDAMESEAKDRWTEALLQGYEGIAQTAIGHVHNIPTHHAMGLYCAGEVFDRTDWKKQAHDFMHQVMAEQSPHGWWAEHMGPVVAYNFVYVESLGVYYKMSGDEAVLDALLRSAQYHSGCVYPDGSMVETVDGRNPYHTGVRLGNIGFCYTPEGRGFLAQQHRVFLAQGKTFDADYAAHMLLYGADGEAIETAAVQEQHVYQMGDQALMMRHRPWFVGLSVFTVPIPQNRWGQDRQNFVSVFHDSVGLIVGGGNTKLQPLWSTFTVGDTSLLAHNAGDEDPDFSAREGLIHVPECAKIDACKDRPSLILAYGDEDCRVTVRPENDDELTLVLAASANTGLPVEAHVTLIPHHGGSIACQNTQIGILSDDAFVWDDAEWIEHAGWQLTVPKGSRVIWPALPHNPYRKDGAAMIEEGLLVVAVPFDDHTKRQELKLRVT